MEKSLGFSCLYKGTVWPSVHCLSDEHPNPLIYLLYILAILAKTIAWLSITFLHQPCIGYNYF